MDNLGELPYYETSQYHKDIILNAWENNKNKGKHALLKIVIFVYKWRLAYILFINLLIAAIESIEPILLK